MSHVAAAALGCRTTTAYRAVVQQGRLDPSESLGVFGCGGLGLSAVLVAGDILASAREMTEAVERALVFAQALLATLPPDANTPWPVRRLLASIALGGGAAVITCNFTQCVPFRSDPLFSRSLSPW